MRDRLKMLFSRHTNGIRIKTARELDLMRTAGRIVAEVHAKMSEMVQPGVSTADLDAAAEAIIRGYDAIPAFVNYPNARQGGPVFPATLCTSINEELVHGIPSQQRVLAEGDIISIDVGVIYNGYVGDSGWTYPVGQVSAEAQRLLETTEGSLWAGIAQAKSNNRFVDVSRAVQEYVEERGFAVVREYTSHGVGSKMHEEPQILNFVPTDRRDAARSYPAMNRRLVSGMTFALEPMVNAGVWETRIHDDEWTVSTKDGSLSAHFEHTIAITNGEPEILTTL